MFNNKNFPSNINRINVPYSKAKDLLHEGDVLLFRGKYPFSYLIKKMSRSMYSHVGIASWHNGELGLWEIVEFRGIRGGRTASLEQIVHQKSGIIDVYRPSSQKEIIHFDSEKSVFTTKVVKCPYKKITHKMRELAGLSYGWRRIWWFIQGYIPILRLIYDMNKVVSDKIGKLVSPVCSTTIAYSFNYNNFDLVKNRSDNWTLPGEIAASSILNYCLTLVSEEETL